MVPTRRPALRTLALPMDYWYRIIPVCIIHTVYMLWDGLGAVWRRLEIRGGLAQARYAVAVYEFYVSVIHRQGIY